MSQAVSEANQKLDSIAKLQEGEMTYENTFGLIDSLGRDVSASYMSIAHLSTLVDNDELRKAKTELISIESSHSAKTTSNEALWQNLKKASLQDWVTTLSPAKQRFVSQVINSFRDQGAELNPEQKARVAQINEELGQLSNKFGQNVLDSAKAWQHIVSDEKQLDGLSDNWKSLAAQAALAKGYGTPEAPQWLISQDYSSYGPVMRNCSNESLRRICWEGSCKTAQIAPYRNEPLVQRILKLRTELAQILNFGNYANLTTARRMLGSGNNALHFIDAVYKKNKNSFDQENIDLLAFISEQTDTPCTAINPWDSRYYGNMISEQQNNFNSEELRPYLNYEHLRDGMFSYFGELFNFSTKRLDTYCPKPGENTPKGMVEVWHPDVEVYEIIDASSKLHLGSFYLDSFPRASKRAGAWVMPIRSGISGTNGQPHAPHLAAIAGNFTPPLKGQPALISHSDLVVLFHEFGHALHCMLSDTEITTHSGTNVAWDFVEQPSQMLEFWAWEPDFLKKHAKHYSTGAPLPDALIAKLQKSKYFRPASALMGHLSVAKLDLEMHINYDKLFRDKDLNESTDSLLADWRAPSTTKVPSIMHRLTHCMNGGYAAGYYSYMWADNLAADAYTRFQKEGINNKATGASYRDKIFSNGDSMPASELYRKFMGREPNIDALLEMRGILPQRKKS